MFPGDKDFIEKGLTVGIHLIDNICNWTQSNYGYDDGRRHDWVAYRKSLHKHLDFTTDCRFHKLEHQPASNETLYGLRKIGMMGVLEKEQPKQWKWNPVNIQVNPTFLQEDEKPKDADRFILEYLHTSIAARMSGEESSRPNKSMSGKQPFGPKKRLSID